MNDDNNLIIYKNSDGNIIVDAIFKDDMAYTKRNGKSF